MGTNCDVAKLMAFVTDHKDYWKLTKRFDGEDCGTAASADQFTGGVVECSDAEMGPMYARWAIFVPSVMMLCHIIPFLVAPIPFMKMFYMGSNVPESAEAHLSLMLQWFSFWIVFVGGSGIGWFIYWYDVQGPTNMFAVYGIFLFQFAIHFALFLTPAIPGYKSTKPGMFQLANMASWIPANIIVACICFAACDSSDALTDAKDFFENTQEAYYISEEGCSKDEPAIMNKTAKWFLLIEGIMLLTHVIPFWVAPIWTFTTFYMGPVKPDAVPVVSWAMHFHGSWALATSAMMICGFYMGGVPSNVYGAFSAGNFLSVVVLIAALTGLDGGHYLKTEPTTMNKMLLASWGPTNFIFGCIFAAAYDPNWD